MNNPKKPIVIMNWSMRQNHMKDAIEFAKQISAKKNSDAGIDVVILPSMGTIYPVHEVIKDTPVHLGVQNIGSIEHGELSGEFSIESLIDMEGTFVELGHWERRKLFNETDDIINKKVKLALNNNVSPILCVGELEKKDADNVIDDLKNPNYERDLEQELFLRVFNGLYCVDKKHLDKIVIAYTPAWAVGQSKAAGAPHIKMATSFIRKAITRIFGEEAKEKVRVVYGGSVSPENSITMIKMADLDGVLLGRFGSDSNRLQQIVDVIKNLKAELDK
ncbi:triose-phosphate isomerase family protein [Candidatus Enterococcus ferrettii]|uniref:Triosephosphate isomerase n=1 Tax=Candidatus Enterococcus ferrettii TaxID=2815324 RepID=A0ABV0EPK8_9ENTE|nr:triose-phosphate isomerase family protein [Enterococcus sp. 665A]MBO1340721.1 triose-phosphate isomerase [Enterococcus sp. 665A]